MKQIREYCEQLTSNYKCAQLKGVVIKYSKKQRELNIMEHTNKSMNTTKAKDTKARIKRNCKYKD